MTFLKVSGIGVTEEGKEVLSDITFLQSENQKIALAGETGSGKSTLLKVLAGFVQPTAGEVIFKEERVKGPGEKLIPGHTGIAYLSQDFSLQKFLRVEQILEYANKLDDDNAERIVRICRIDHLLSRKTNQLSGGERQRVALARLLLMAPDILLLDEPFSNLDMMHKSLLKTVIDELKKELEITCILVSHDPLDVLSWADHLLVMKNGKIIQQGPPMEIYRKPADEYVAGLFGKYNLIKPERAGVLSKISGIYMNGRNLLIRPEHFKVVSKEDEALAGRIDEINYFGSYYELMVAVQDMKVIVRTTENNFKKGDKIYISVDAANIWHCQN